MSNEKMREEFEVWYSKELGFREDNQERMFSMFCDDGENHDYYRLSVRFAWSSWQASRAALCVELPSRQTVICGTDLLDRELVEQALDVAGVSH